MDLVKVLVWNALVKAVIEKLIAALPFSAGGPIAYVIGFIVTKISDAIYSELKLWFELERILITNESIRKQWDKASIHLAVVSIDHGPESKEYRDALNENEKAFSNLIKFKRAD